MSSFDGHNRAQLRIMNLSVFNSKNEGFTLTEMLATMLIMVLASTLLATGIPVAIDTYHNIVKSANAQLALSTTISVLRSELGMANDIRVRDSAIYYCSDEGYWACIRNPRQQESYRGLVKQYCMGDGPATSSLEDIGTLTDYVAEDGTNMAYPLIPDASIAASRGADDIWLRYELGSNGVALSSDKKLLTINGLYVFEDKDYNPEVSTTHQYSPGDALLAHVGGDDAFKVLIRFASS